MTRIIKRLVIVTAVAFAALGFTAAVASAASSTSHASGTVSATSDIDWN